MEIIRTGRCIIGVLNIMKPTASGRHAMHRL